MSHTDRGPQHPRRRGLPSALPPPPLTEGELRALYDERNRSRFGGRLPRARRDWKEPCLQAWVEWQRPPAGLIASTHPKSGLVPSIWMSPIMLSSAFADAPRVRRVLLHEMCHVEVGLDLDVGAGGDALAEGSHGPRWRPRWRASAARARRGSRRTCGTWLRCGRTRSGSSLGSWPRWRNWTRGWTSRARSKPCRKSSRGAGANAGASVRRT